MLQVFCKEKGLGTVFLQLQCHHHQHIILNAQVILNISVFVRLPSNFQRFGVEDEKTSLLYRRYPSVANPAFAKPVVVLIAGCSAVQWMFLCNRPLYYSVGQSWTNRPRALSRLLHLPHSGGGSGHQCQNLSASGMNKLKLF